MTREEAIKILSSRDGHGIPSGYNGGYAEAIEVAIEALKAEPIKHGRWLMGVGENGEPIGTYCSECGWSWERNIAAIQLNRVLSRIETPRCPHCGARMDGITDGVAEEIIKEANKACANCQEFVCDECEYRHWRTR